MSHPFADRPLPRWYDDAKLGIFVHWTSAAVPAFAPIGPSPFELGEMDPSWGLAMANSPYVEWYQNSLAIEGSPVAEHHRATYGDQPYDVFVHQFAQLVERWQPSSWAELFRRAGARYVVLVSKHHDGFCLWPTDHPNPHRDGWSSSRDVVGELGAEVRAAGMRYGLYYSGGIDWTFEAPPMGSFMEMVQKIPSSPEYCSYAEAHMHELIAREQPCSLWNDIAWPFSMDPNVLFEHYYGAVPDGVVNDRYNLLAVRNGTLHADFSTPEYSTTAPEGRKWETCRGIGTSFGYNRLETDATYFAADELVRFFVDVVARGGNLLLNVGPSADGTIPWPQAQRLLALGWWLETNGEAIFGTHPWRRQSDATSHALPVRFTATDAALYCTLLATPRSTTVVLRDLVAPDGAELSLLGRNGTLRFTQQGADLAVELPDLLPDAPAHVLRCSPCPA